MHCKVKFARNYMPSLGEAPVLEIRCYPKMSKDANGSTETIDIRWFLT